MVGSLVTAFLLTAGSVQAQAPEFDKETGIPDPSIATSLPQKGDPGGIRKWLNDHGLNYTFIYTNDVLSNLAGGIKRGTVDQGKLEGMLLVDLEKLAGWQGLSFYANFFQIHNTGRMLREFVGGINTIAAIEAVPTTRLSELWIEKKFMGDAASFRIGQLAADTEFFFSELSNNMFLQSDWPTIAAVNLPSGGPAYPLSTPGMRVKYDANKDASFLLAVFNGDPAGPGTPGEEQLRNRYGLNFRVTDPPLIIGEAQFRANQEKKDTGPASKVKIGFWTHTGEFNDQRFAGDGRLLADPASNGIPQKHPGNFGIYGVVERQLYRPAGAEPDKGISVFSRASLSPSDRNLIDAYIDGGIIFAGLLAQRPEDRFGASFIYSRFSDSVRAFDQDRITFGQPGPVRDFEANLELTYVAQIVPGWTIQPDAQYIWHPSGHAGRDAKVVGVRSIWKY